MDREKDEKESDEEEWKHLHQPTSDCLPIMHWEELGLRIAELEGQEQERRERSKSGAALRSVLGGREEELWGASGTEEQGDLRRCHISGVMSRLPNHRNLQLCFINYSDSDDEENDKKVATATASNGYHHSGLKQEVAAALRDLRDKVLEEQRERQCMQSSAVAKQKPLEECELSNCTLQQLNTLKTSLLQDVHDLSSELVDLLLVRDHLRTRQDALLLDVQDLT